LIWKSTSALTAVSMFTRQSGENLQIMPRVKSDIRSSQRVPYNQSRSNAMHSEYIEQRHGGYYVAGTRISLDSVVYSFNEGQSPEAIQEDFPSLKRAQIYGAIAFYLDHQAEIDKYLVDTEREFEGNAIPLEQANPALWAKIQRAKAEAAQGERRS
jgi:uncharacterized protein (DUF433 family)